MSLYTLRLEGGQVVIKNHDLGTTTVLNSVDDYNAYLAAEVARMGWGTVDELNEDWVHSSIEMMRPSKWTSNPRVIDLAISLS